MRTELAPKLGPSMKGLLYDNELIIWGVNSSGESNHLRKHENLGASDLPVAFLTYTSGGRISVYAPFEDFSIGDLVELAVNHIDGTSGDRVELVKGFKTVWDGFWQEMGRAEREASQNPPLAVADEVEEQVIGLIAAELGRVAMAPPYIKLLDIGGQVYVFVTRDYRARSKPALFLGGLYIDKAQRGMGQGGQIMGALADIADDLGLRIYLDAHPYEMDDSERTGLKKDRLKEFYRSFGFKDASRQMKLGSGYHDMMIREPK